MLFTSLTVFVCVFPRIAAIHCSNKCTMRSIWRAELMMQSQQPVSTLHAGRRRSLDLSKRSALSLDTPRRRLDVASSSYAWLQTLKWTLSQLLTSWWVKSARYVQTCDVQTCDSTWLFPSILPPSPFFSPGTVPIFIFPFPCRRQLVTLQRRQYS